MHIPDGFLDTKTIVATYALSAGALGYSIKKTKEELSDRQIPTMGVLAAFIFAAQMVNGGHAFNLRRRLRAWKICVKKKKDSFKGIIRPKVLLTVETPRN